MIGLGSQVKPSSTIQVEEHPSPLILFPSSQFSEGINILSPQMGGAGPHWPEEYR
jgi:hypothetical protein